MNGNNHPITMNHYARKLRVLDGCCFHRNNCASRECSSLRKYYSNLLRRNYLDNQNWGKLHSPKLCNRVYNDHAPLCSLTAVNEPCDISMLFIRKKVPSRVSLHCFAPASQTSWPTSSATLLITLTCSHSPSSYICTLAQHSQVAGSFLHAS